MRWHARAAETLRRPTNALILRAAKGGVSKDAMADTALRRASIAFAPRAASLAQMRPAFLSVLFAFAVAGPAAAQAAAPAACAPPKPMQFRVDGEIRRDTLGFTQGLEVYGDKLYESTGAIAGDTRLNTIDGKGRVTQLASFGKRIFGEGLTILKDRVYQISWQDHVVNVFDLSGKQLGRMANKRDGWGLTNDGAQLIYTDGGDRLYFVDPASFADKAAVPVRAGQQPVRGLNELEWVDGKIYANIFTTWTIVRIDPKSGCVEASASLNGLWNRMSEAEKSHITSDTNFVLNGIAYDRTKKLFYLTGKNWNTIFTGHFDPG
jgi:glutaminyl-peptide cyclotransferase